MFDDWVYSPEKISNYDSLLVSWTSFFSKVETGTLYSKINAQVHVCLLMNLAVRFASLILLVVYLGVGKDSNSVVQAVYEF